MPTLVISGANRGLGLEFVRQYLADTDMQIIAGVRDPTGALELQALADAEPGRVQVTRLDVSDAASVAEFKRTVGDRPVDILIANAGVYGGEQSGPGKIDFDDWLQVFATNTLGPMRLADALLPNVQAGGGKRMAAITSRMGSTADNSGGGAFAYRSSKAALNNAWNNLALAVKRDGIACAVLHPGWVKTDMGGAGAQIEPATSIAGMRRVIDGLTLERSGGFFAYDGKAIPW